LLSPFLILGGACVRVLCALAQMPVVDDQAQYIYADLCYLAQVIDEQGKVALITCRSFWQGVGKPF
jgi:hypothetical protein